MGSTTYNTEKLDLFLEAHEGSPEWAQLYPRHYHTPEGYLPAKYVSAIMGVAITMAPLLAREAWAKGMYAEEANITVANFVARKVVQTGVQQFWLGRSLGEALLRTSVPKDALLRDTPWPFPGMVIYLPKGILSTEKSGDVAFISMAIHTPADHARWCNGELIEEARFILNAGSITESGIAADWYATYPLHCTMEELFDPSYFRHSEICPEIRAASDNAVASKLIELVINTCYYMAQAVESVEIDAIGGKRKRGKEVTPWWTPRWVGRRYMSDRRELGGSHLSPRMHWRRGHFRAQRHGEGWTQIRQTWIEPTLVNSGEPLETT